MHFFLATFTVASLYFIDICDACGSQYASDLSADTHALASERADANYSSLEMSEKSVTVESEIALYSTSGAYNDSLQFYHESELLPAFSVKGYLRKLVGSNCVLIERGTISPYYECIGCDIRTAMGCLRDLRSNKSRNVDPQCSLASLNEGSFNAACCPRFRVARDTGKRFHLLRKLLLVTVSLDE